MNTKKILKTTALLLILTNSLLINSITIGNNEINKYSEITTNSIVSSSPTYDQLNNITSVQEKDDNLYFDTDINRNDPTYISLNINQNDFYTRNLVETLTGTIDSNKDVFIKYTNISNVDDSIIFTGDGKILDDNSWCFDNIELISGNNTILITAYADDGYEVTKTINIVFDPGISYTPINEDFASSPSGIIYNKNVLYVNFANDIDDSSKEAIINSINGEIVGSSYVLNEEDIRVPSSSLDELQDIVNHLNELPEIDLACINYYNENKPDVSFSDHISTSPQDYMAQNNDNSWGYYSVGADKVRNFYLNKINVGIIEQGFQLSHEDLPVLNNCIKVGDDLSPENVSKYHSTHVAGIISAKNSNGKGLEGVAYNAQLVLSPYGYSNPTTDIAIIKAIQNGAKVVNCSFGLSGENSTQESINSSATRIAVAMNDLLSNRKDFLLIQSAGNDNRDCSKNGSMCTLNLSNVDKYNTVTYNRQSAESILNRIIIVGSYNRNCKSSWSNWGDNVTIMAPGSKIRSCVSNNFKAEALKKAQKNDPKIESYDKIAYKYDLQGTNNNDNYAYLNGTSMAAPYVSSAAALIWGINPNMKAPQVKKYIVDNATSSISYYTSSNRKEIKPKLNIAKAFEAAYNDYNTEEVEYSVYIDKNRTWSNFVSQDTILYDTTYNSFISKLRIRIKNKQSSRKYNVTYPTYIQYRIKNSYWQPWVCDGLVTGSTNSSISALEIKLNDELAKCYDIKYSLQGRRGQGGVSWGKSSLNGSTAILPNYYGSLYGIKIRIIPKTASM